MFIYFLGQTKLDRKTLFPFFFHLLLPLARAHVSSPVKLRSFESMHVWEQKEGITSGGFDSKSEEVTTNYIVP